MHSSESQVILYVPKLSFESRSRSRCDLGSSSRFSCSKRKQSSQILTNHTLVPCTILKPFFQGYPGGQQQIWYYISHKLPHATQATSAGTWFCRCDFFSTLHILRKRSYRSAKKLNWSETTSVLEKKMMKIFRFCWHSESRTSWYKPFHSAVFKKYGGTSSSVVVFLYIGCLSPVMIHNRSKQ